MSERHRFRHHPLLGTVVDVEVAGNVTRDVAAGIDGAVIAEIGRLEKIFNVFDPSSELERWKRHEVADPSDEFCEVMRLALDWHLRSAGAFNPAVGVISAAWRDAEANGVAPAPRTLARLAASISEPRFRLDDGRPVLVADCSGLNVNALAKGWIVDRASQLAAAEFPDLDLVVNSGGDLRHRGRDSVLVGIEHPLRPYDNEPPVASIAVANAGLATSGRARRGFRVGERWYSHVIDPRTGATVDDLASISVLAPSAAEADVIATVAGVLDAPGARACCDDLGVGCLVVDRDGHITTNDGWSSRACVSRTDLS